MSNNNGAFISNLRNNFNLSNKDNNSSFANEKNKDLDEKKLEEEKERNDIRDKLKCFICFGKVVNAMMCPHCKKLACEQCIKTVLEKTSTCSYCKNLLLIDELVKIPMLNDFTFFFINNMEQKNEKDENDVHIMAQLRKEKCKEHPNKNIEYYCMNCNQYLCSESLLFFNKKSVDQHKNHIILSFDDIEKFNLYKIIKEYSNLRENKAKINNKLNVLNKSLNDMKNLKNSTKDTYGILKTDLKGKYENKIYRIKNILNTLNLKKTSIQNILNKSSNLMLDLNDEEKSKQFLEELKNLNNIDISKEDIENEANFKKAFKYEQFESDKIEIKLPYDGKYIDEYKIIDTELNFIPDTKCKLNCQLLMNSLFFSLTLEINKQFIDERHLKIKSTFYIETKNMKHGISPESAKTNNEYIFSAECDYNIIKNMIEKEGECFYKFNIIIFYYK